ALARKGLEPARRDPIGHPFRRLLLEEAPARKPLAPPLHRERPVAQMREERGRDLPVVVEEIALRDAVLGEEHPIAARKLDLRHSRSSSRAITSRWIWFVPS